MKNLILFALLLSASATIFAQKTVSVRINSATDDFEEWLKPVGGQTQSKTIGSMDVGSSDLEFGTESSGNDPQMVGLRFGNLNIPKGSLILNAYIQFKVDATSKNNDPCIVHFKIQDSDSASTFTANNFDLTSRNKLSDSITWSVSGSSWGVVGSASIDQRSADLSTLIQKTINRSGWKAGNALALFLYGSGTREVESYDGDATSAPQLVITYVEPVTISKRIAAADDDMEEWISPKSGQTQSKTIGALDAGSSDLEFGTESTGNDPQIVGMRFTSMNIPKGALITNAYIQFAVDATNKNNDPCNVILKGENSDSALIYIPSQNNNISQRSKTTDSVTWAVSGSSWSNVGAATIDQRTPNLKNIIQEVIKRNGWKTGNPISIFMYGTGTREVESYDGDATKAPMLVIEYIPVKTLQIRVSSADDDQEEWIAAKSGQTQSKSIGVLDAGSSDLELGTESSGNDPQMVGIKFNNIQLPKGAKFSNAYIQFTVDATSKNSDPCEITLRAENTDSALAYDVTKNFNITSRTYSSDSVNWSVSGATWSTVGAATADQRTPNLSKLIEKIVARNNWKPGNSIAFNLVGKGTREVESYDGDAIKSPLLVIEYYGGDGAAVVKPRIPVTNFPIAKKSNWLYSDSGLNLGSTWKNSIYKNDTNWYFGAGPLGYGHLGFTSTDLLSGPTNNKFITHYFRKAFIIPSLGALTDTLDLQLMCDDGAVVYVNGVEVVRRNLPTGAVNSRTKALSKINSPLERMYWLYNIPKSALKSDTNVIAVEIHQSDSLSSDAIFDLALNNRKFRPNNPAMGCVNAAGHISCFTSVIPTEQRDTLSIPSTHKFQAILKTGDAYSKSGLVPSNFDFTGYVADKGNSKKGYVALNHELTPGGVSILNTQFNCQTGSWVVDSVHAVDFSGPLVKTARNCSGGITPWGTVVTCEEDAPAGDLNSDGYEDIGWNIEIDPVTRKVKQYGNGIPEKCWAMGRMSHENVAFLNDSITSYYGEDEADGSVYKFVADKKANLSAGKLYALKLDQPLNASGDPTGTTATWILIPNATKAERNNVKNTALALGATKFNGVEDVEVNPLNGDLYFTAKGVGRVYKFKDNGSTISNFSTFAGGETYLVNYGGGIVAEDWGGGNDNLTFDDKGNLWVLQDGGRNHIWLLRPDHTQTNPKVELFMVSPAGSEPTGMTFTPDYKYMFLSIQEPNAQAVQQKDVTGKSVLFNKSHTLVIARSEMFKAQSLPTPVISGPLSVLPNSTNSYSVSGVQGNQYFWTAVDGNIESGNGTKAVSVKWGAVDGKLKVYEKQNQYCFSGESLTSVLINSSSINNVIEDAGLTIKPNPSSGVFILNSPKDAQISVMDYTGKILFSSNTNSNADFIINLEKYNDGVYYVLVIDGESKKAIKIVKL